MICRAPAFREVDDLLIDGRFGLIRQNRRSPQLIEGNRRLLRQRVVAVHAEDELLRPAEVVAQIAPIVDAARERDVYLTGAQAPDQLTRIRLRDGDDGIEGAVAAKINDRLRPELPCIA